jgi:hypothetical protein
MSDDELLAGFDAGALPVASFDHGMHVRVAWLCLREDGLEDATERIAGGLRALTRAAGVPEKFDLALTTAWCARIAAAIASDPGTGAFDDFLARRPDLLRR